MSSSQPVGTNFPRNPCRLETTASVISAAVLYRRAVTLNPTNPAEKVKDIVSLHPTIEKKIERFMPLVKEQITWWNDFYDREIFFDKPSSRAHEYFHVLVWSADGTINDEETAREMLKRDDLNAEEKYRIACNHCLQNEIKKLRSNLKTEIDMGKAERYALLHYWESVRRKKRTTGFITYINTHILNGKYAYPVCAVDYFLDRLNFEKRVNYLGKAYLQKMTFKSWEKFLMKLTNQQFMSLFCNNQKYFCSMYLDLHLMLYLMRFWTHADFVKQVWIRVGEDFHDTSFHHLMTEYIFCQLFPSHSADHVSLAVEILHLAPSYLQFATYNDYFFDKWWNRKSNLTEVGLDVAILSYANPNYKRDQFWPERWFDFFTKHPVDCFVQLMDAYCGKEGSEEFKKKVMEMNDDKASEYCYTLLREMRFAELDNFLGIFSSDKDSIMKTKQIILRKNLIERADWFEKDDVIIPASSQLVDFIERSFENIRLANEFKTEVLSSVNCLNARYKVAGNDVFSWLKESVWLRNYNDDDFKLYKNKFLQLDVELAKSSEIADVFKDPGWKSFLEWCSGENLEMSKFSLKWTL
ncbi:uncharacterized protein LOC135844912 isoform X7 [Planococcus citri]|uniref:uncharacterized protein LOC135844912 isoform X7 n=1 Tax=Planococcus citri TaxID=170843 RepID=UPI0031F832A5